MDTDIRLSFRYTEQDYVRGFRTHFRTRLRLGLDLFVVVALCAIGIYLWPSVEGIVAVAVSLTFLLMLLAGFFVIPRWVFRREPKFRDEYTLTFSSEGIHFRTAHIDSQLQWNLYFRAIVGPHSYLLYYGSTQYSIIPKRVFRSVEERRQFEEMIARHIPKIEKRAASQGEGRFIEGSRGA